MPGAERSQPGLTPQSGLTPAERELEDALRGLSPVASRIDRDRLLFAAGAAAGQARGRRAVGSVAGVLILCLAFAFIWRPEPPERLVFVPASQPAGVNHLQPSGGKNVAPESAPVTLASLNPVPFPVPGGPFVAVPRGWVGKMGVDPAALPTASYLEKIQHVFRNGWSAKPGEADDSGGAAPRKDVPLDDDAHRS